MIDKVKRFNDLTERQEDMLGNVNRAYTATLRVWANGSGADGLSWRTAYKTIQDALNAASTDGDACTLILIAPHTTNYDIDTTGDPTWSANVVLQGSHRNWAKIMNTHASATSILKLIGKSGVFDLNFNLGTDPRHGLILTHGGARVKRCQFVGEDLTDGPAVALWLAHASGGKHAKIIDCGFKGHPTRMLGVYIDQWGYSDFEELRIHNCAVGIGIAGANSDENIFRICDIGGCLVGLDIDAGNEQHLHDIIFHDNTVNIDDEVHDHIWNNIFGAFPLTIEPDNLTGVTVVANAAADVWGADTELRAAATSTVPFRIVAVIVAPAIAQLHELRISSDSGSTFDNHLMVEATRGVATPSPSGTEYIYNAGTRISCSMKAASGGSDEAKVWLKIQEI